MGVFSRPPPPCVMDNVTMLRSYVPASFIPLFLPGLLVFVVATVARWITFITISDRCLESPVKRQGPEKVPRGRVARGPLRYCLRLGGFGAALRR